MDLKDAKKKLAAAKGELRARFGITSISIFGSYSRGKQKKGSDLDLLAEFSEVPSIFTLVRAEQYLEEKLGIDVDLAYAHGLKQSFRSSIAGEAVMV